MYTFAILLTMFFSGKLFKCDLEHTQLSSLQKLDLIKTKWDCVNYGGLWKNSDNNFDSTLASMKAIFVIMTKESLVNSIRSTMDAQGIDLQPEVNYNPAMAIIIVIITILFALLFVNMFAGVVIETFNREKDILNLNNLLSYEQRSWILI